MKLNRKPIIFVNTGKKSMKSVRSQSCGPSNRPKVANTSSRVNSFNSNYKPPKSEVKIVSHKLDFKGVKARIDADGSLLAKHIGGERKQVCVFNIVL